MPKIPYARTMFCLILLFLSHTTFAQLGYQQQVDSLTQVFDKTHDIEHKKRLLKALSNLYGDKGDWKKYEGVMKEMLLLQEEETDSFYLAETYNKLGISSCCLGNNQEAVHYFQKALEINKAQKMDLIVANSYENMGLAYRDMGDYQQAVHCLLKSLEIRKEKNHPRVFNNYMKLAVLQQLLGNVEREDHYITLAKQEMLKQDKVTPRNKAIFYNELGNIYNKRSLYDSCMVCYQNVIEFSQQIGWNRGIAEGTGNLADLYSKLGMIDSSIVYHKRSLALSEEIQDCGSTSEECLYLAKLYEKKQSRDSAIFFAHKALGKAQNCNLLKEQADALAFLADFYKGIGDFKTAYTSLESYNAIKDSIASSDVKNSIAELETKYESQRKEQQISLLTAENSLSKQKTSLAWLFVSFLIVLVALALYLLRHRRKQASYRHAELQQQLLRSQMNPHFIYNVMGSVQGFLYNNEANKAAEYLSKFAALSRSVLEFSAQESISLKEEIDMLKNYIELENARLPHPFKVVFSYDEDMEADFIQVPPMLLQPFVENAIKHGLSKLDHAGTLSIHFKESTQHIEVEIRDNGVGFQKNMKGKHHSKALDIFEQRRKGIEQKFKKRITFEIEDLKIKNEEAHGVRVYLQLPILNND